jgi:YD repeat-containing protein
MTTYTFLPQVGKTSETDPSGRSTYYQYDGLQRLNLVLDQNGNITKKYSYSYAGAQSTRPVIKSTAFGGPGPGIGALVNFIPPAKCETVLPHFTDLNTGQSYTGGAGGPNSPALITPLTSFHTYSITIYCYSSAFPSPMISDPFTLYVPF